MSTNVGGARTAVLWTAWAVGAAALLSAAVTLWRFDDSCLQWEDEGPMAAPHSPYSLVMCAPQDPPVTWSVLVSAVAGAALVGLLLRRRRASGRRTLLAAGALGLVVAPALVLGLLHLTLPLDCLTGTTETGSCSRDRERR